MRRFLNNHCRSFWATNTTRGDRFAASRPEFATRAFVAVLLVAIVVMAAPAAENNEDKAKEVTVAFIKALKAKDVDALLKTVDLPCAFDWERLNIKNSRTIAKPEELKEALAKLSESASPEKIEGLKPGTVYDMAALMNSAKASNDKGYIAFAERAEKLVGKTGYQVKLVNAKGKEGNGLLIRIKDGKAFVAGIPK